LLLCVVVVYIPTALCVVHYFSGWELLVDGGF